MRTPKGWPRLPLLLASLASLVSLGALGACRPPASSDGATPASAAPVASTGEAAWLLAGSSDERFSRVAKHLRGFDVAMVEVGYRYAELYWAGRDRNWGYAAYQLDKIERAVANGVERRPKRAASAKMLDEAVVPLRSSLESKSAEAFDAAFAHLTATCNRCHEAERVPFVRVAPPAQRQSVVSAPSP